MQATPSTAFKMSEPDLLLELKIVTLDAPPELGGVNEATTLLRSAGNIRPMQ